MALLTHLEHRWIISIALTSACHDWRQNLRSSRWLGERLTLAEHRAERRLAAILAADVAGYSRLMGADEEGTLSLLKAHRCELVDPKLSGRSGHDCYVYRRGTTAPSFDGLARKASVTLNGDELAQVSAPVTGPKVRLIPT
jgi:class 3 adenylate cyclase